MPPNLPDLPRRTPNWDALDFSGAPVYTATVGQTAASAIANAVALLTGPVPMAVCKLRHNTTYTESLVGTNFGSTGWVLVTTDGSLPTFGTRMTPALATTYQLPKIVSLDSNNAIRHAPGARGWRWQGLEITASTAESTYPLIRTGLDIGSITGVADLPQRLSFRQNYIHGNVPHQSRIRGFETNGSWLEICDNWVERINYGGVTYSPQCQSISGYSGLGVQRIENNFLWGALECLAYGGAGQYRSVQRDGREIYEDRPDLPSQFGSQFEGECCLLSDITVRRNHIYRPWSAKGDGSTSTDEGSANGIEFKIGRRILIECNIFENCWNNLQNGYGTATWSVNQSGGEWWIQTCDITIRYNWFKNYNSGLSISGIYGSPVPPYPVRFHAHNNVWTGLGTPMTFAPGSGSTFGDWMTLNDAGVHHIWIHHNTGITNGSICVRGQSDPFTYLWIEDNVAGMTDYNYFTGGGSGQTGWDLSNTNGTCQNRRNVYVGTGLVPNVASQHGVVSGLSSVGFVNSSYVMSNTVKYADLGNLALSGTSPYKGVGPGGTDPGCNFTTLNTQLAGVEAASADLPP